ncbi:MAG: cystathionine beta-lyase [Rickettsiales bacterium]|nr:cystathionine beta-lyase [Rickettsiales bacterium]
MKTKTKYTHVGRDPFNHGRMVNPPPMRGSTILFKDFAEYQLSRQGKLGTAVYGRYGNQVTEKFTTDLCDLFGAEGVILTGCGNSAFATALLALLSAGDHLLMIDTVYEPTRHFCDKELTRLGIEVTYYDPALGSDIEALFQDNTKVVYAESPGSLTFEVQDIRALSAVTHKHDAYLVLDNTWGAPLLCEPFELGVDLWIASASKYLSGHSDLLMGIACANEKTWPALKRAHKNIGANAGSEEIFLMMRGMRTLGVRLPAHEKVALEIAHWLKTQPEVTQILHPAFEECPGHEYWKRDFNGSNGLFAFRTIAMSDAQIAAFVDNLHHFGMGWSWGGYESLILPLWLDNIRTASKVGDGQLFRVHIGLEDAGDLKADLDNGFTKMRAISA